MTATTSPASGCPTSRFPWGLTGWSLRQEGEGFPDSCGQHGQFIPFAFTKAERRAAGDPRPSINERYPTHGHYVNAIGRAARNLVQQRFLLNEDKDRMVERADLLGVNRWLAVAPTE